MLKENREKIMEVKQRHMALSPAAKRILQEQRKLITVPRHDSDAIYRQKMKNQTVCGAEREISCCLYSILLKTDVNPKYQPLRAFSTEMFWNGGLYYTIGPKIESVSEQSIDDCIAVVKETDKNYKEINGRKIYTVPKSNSYIYLYSNGNLHLMDSPEHPDVPKNSYSFSEKLCMDSSHINIVNETVKRALSQHEQAGVVLTKKTVS